MHITINHAILASMTVAFGFAVTVCSEDKFQEMPDRNELYDRAFIKEFGSPHPDHDWTMATTAGLRVISPKAVNLQVYAEIDENLYIFADIPGFQGDNAVPVTIPKGIDQLIVVADGTEYPCSPSATLDLSTATPSRGGRDITIRDPNKKGEYFSITPNPGRTKYITLNLEENPELNQILEDPYNSPYLQTTSVSNDWYGGPLMPNVSNLYSPLFSEAQSFDLCWFCVRPREAVYKNDITTYLCASTDPFAMQPDSTLRISVGTSIKTSSDNVNWVDNREPSIESGPYVKFDWMNFDIDVSKEIYLSFAINHTSSSGLKSYTNSRYNYPGWDTRFYDATIKDMNTSYCSTLFYKEVPIKWTRDGETSEDEVAVYAMYYGPHNAAEQRSEKPQVYLLEHHSYGYVQWNQPFYEPKKASTYPWRIYTEDLGGSYDWDFNDLIVEFSDIITRYEPDYIPDSFIPDETHEGYYHDKENDKHYYVPPYSTLYPKFNDTDLDGSLLVREITVTPLASGGTLPIYLGWKGKASASGGPADPDMLLSEYIKSGPVSTMQDGEFIVGCEMHKWLGGSSTGVPINVGEYQTHHGKTAKFYIPANDYPAHDGWEPTSLGFFAIVDPDNTLGADTSANFDPGTPENDGKPGLTPVNIDNWQDGYTVEMPRVDASSKIPQMFVTVCSGPWAREGISIALANNNFYKYVQNPSQLSPNWIWGFDKSLSTYPTKKKTR